MSPYSIPPLMSAFLTLFLGIFTLLNNRRAKLSEIFFVLTVAIAIWQTCFGIAYSIKTPESALRLFRLGYLGVLLLPPAGIHFHFELLNRRPVWLIRMMYALYFFALPLSWTPQFFSGVKLFFWGYYPQGGMIYRYFIPIYVISLWAAPLICCREAFINKSSETLNPTQLKQLRAVVIASFLSNFAVIDFFAKFGLSIYPFGYINILLWCVALVFAILKYDVMNSEKVAELVHTTKLAAVGTLAASINHEIRNPLYIIQALAESHLANLEEGIYSDQRVMSEKANEILKKTTEQAKRAMDIMKRFAVFAKQEIRQEALSEKVDLNQTLNDILLLVNHELELDKIQLKREIAVNLPAIQADKRHIEEILFNLIVNSCQAMKEKGGEIRISMARHNESVNVTVEDNGPGIPSGRLKQIFEPFYTTKQEGTGLGLYVTKQLIERNEGKISAKSQLGKGTSFILEFKPWQS